MNAYAKKRPDATAELLAGPFELLRVESWGGPRPCAADRSEQRPNGNATSQHLLLPVEEAVCVLHDVARISQHAWDKDAIEVEILAASSTALALRQTPSHALVGVGERLNRMLSDPEAELGAMHALVDAALEQGEQAYRGLALARDERGRGGPHDRGGDAAGGLGPAGAGKGEGASRCEHFGPSSLVAGGGFPTSASTVATGAR